MEVTDDQHHEITVTLENDDGDTEMLIGPVNPKPKTPGTSGA